MGVPNTFVAVSAWIKSHVKPDWIPPNRPIPMGSQWTDEGLLAVLAWFCCMQEAKAMQEMPQSSLAEALRNGIIGYHDREGRAIEDYLATIFDPDDFRVGDNVVEDPDAADARSAAEYCLEQDLRAHFNLKVD